MGKRGRERGWKRGRVRDAEEGRRRIEDGREVEERRKRRKEG